MSNFLKADETFSKEDYSNHVFGAGEFESCRFVDCNFQVADLSEVVFLECEFDKCDWSNVQLKQAGLRDVTFRNCKLLGLRFDDCNPFLLEFKFEESTLDLSSFYALSLKKTRFQRCQLHEVDFVEADFVDCDLKGALFERTNLQKADLRTAHNYLIDPNDNQIKKAKFSWPEAGTLLDKYDISISS